MLPTMPSWPASSSAVSSAPYPGHASLAPAGLGPRAVAADRVVDTLATVVLAMITYHLAVTAEPIDEAFITSVFAEVLLHMSLADRPQTQPCHRATSAARADAT